MGQIRDLSHFCVHIQLKMNKIIIVYAKKTYNMQMQGLPICILDTQYIIQHN